MGWLHRKKTAASPSNFVYVVRTVGEGMDAGYEILAGPFSVDDDVPAPPGAEIMDGEWVSSLVPVKYIAPGVTWIDGSSMKIESKTAAFPPKPGGNSPPPPPHPGGADGGAPTPPHDAPPKPGGADPAQGPPPMDHPAGPPNDPNSAAAQLAPTHDGKVHCCPFCGSGNVVGGSDGSVSCGFCSQSFKVYAEPSHPFMPRFVNGQPYDVPGLPQDPDQPFTTADGPVPDQGASPMPSDGVERFRVDQTALGGPGAPGGAPGASGGSVETYRVAKGLLSRDAYVKHLAILNAETYEEWQQVIANVKNSNASTKLASDWDDDYDDQDEDELWDEYDMEHGIITCPRCARVLLNEDLDRTHGKCPNCGQKFGVDANGVWYPNYGNDTYASKTANNASDLRITYPANKSGNSHYAEHGATQALCGAPVRPEGEVLSRRFPDCRRCEQIAAGRSAANTVACPECGSTDVTEHPDRTFSDGRHDTYVCDHCKHEWYPEGSHA